MQKCIPLFLLGVKLMEKKHSIFDEEYVRKQLQALLKIDSPTGYTSKVADYIISELTDMGYTPSLKNKGSVICTIDGDGTPLLLAAHIDTLGGIVSEIKPDGHLRITSIGTLYATSIEGENCRVHTRSGKVYTGFFQMIDPSLHINTNLQNQARDFSNMEIILDEKVYSENDTRALGVRVGDFVGFEQRTVFTESGYIKSRFLDDTVSLSLLLLLAKKIASGDVSTKRKLYLYFSAYEEVGHGAISSIPEDTVEVLDLDIGCIGTETTASETCVSICAKDMFGPYNYEMTSKLIETAEAENIPYSIDIYPFYTSDADSALLSGADIKHALIGPGVCATHGYERTHMDSLLNTFRLLIGYIS
jgi:putative aminopeptidase FrvX